MTNDFNTLIDKMILIKSIEVLRISWKSLNLKKGIQWNHERWNMKVNLNKVYLY